MRFFYDNYWIQMLINRDLDIGQTLELKFIESLFRFVESKKSEILRLKLIEDN